MSGPFEKYVEKAAEAGWNSKLPTYWLDEAKQTWSEVPEWKDADENDKQYARQTTLAALAAVGPLIAEDTRERMVAAAGAALEREGVVDPYCQLAEIRELHAAIPVPQPSQFTAWCNECSTTWPCITAKILEGES